MYEIERKFLVANDGWRHEIPRKITTITQGYIPSPNACVRVRLADSSEVTFKSRPLDTKRRKRFEFNLPIANEKATVMLKELCAFSLFKQRFVIEFDESSCDVGNRWEIDVFHGDHAGLVMAEIELFHEDDVFFRPVWLGKEVTDDVRYSNFSLAKYGLPEK